MEIRSDNKAVMDYNITCGDIDGNSHARLAIYENLVQEAAGMHATMRGLGIYDLQPQGRTWVIARSRMEIHRYSKWPRSITVTTWPLDSTGFNCPRHVEAQDSDGNRLFDCDTKWAVINFKTGRPMRSTEVTDIIKTPPKELQGEVKLPNLSEDDEKSQIILYRHSPHVHYLDTDLNRHVNNLVYINWCLDALPDSFRDAYKPSLIDVRWLKQCFRHDNLTVVARAADHDELSKEEPGIWFDIIRTEESGAQTKVFDAWSQWKKRELICEG